LNSFLAFLLYLFPSSSYEGLKKLKKEQYLGHRTVPPELQINKREQDGACLFIKFLDPFFEKRFLSQVANSEYLFCLIMGRGSV